MREKIKKTIATMRASYSKVPQEWRYAIVVLTALNVIQFLR